MKKPCKNHFIPLYVWALVRKKWRSSIPHCGGKSDAAFRTLWPTPHHEWGCLCMYACERAFLVNVQHVLSREGGRYIGHAHRCVNECHEWLASGWMTPLLFAQTERIITFALKSKEGRGRLPIAEEIWNSLSSRLIVRKVRGKERYWPPSERNVVEVSLYSFVFLPTLCNANAMLPLVHNSCFL